MASEGGVTGDVFFCISSVMRQFPPRRIVCLTEETVETLYLLGEQDRIVGVSGYAVRPPRVRREKPRVSAFISADIPKILALEPDLVLAFSDLQAEIVADLVRAGVAIHVFNQRDIAGILAMIRTLGALVGMAERADQLATTYEKRLADVASISRQLPKPKVYFEEWDDPLISGIGWVSELIEIAGGEDILPKLRFSKPPRIGLFYPTSFAPQHPTSFSHRGAARKSFQTGSGNGRAGTRFQPSPTTASSRSNRR